MKGILFLFLILIIHVANANGVIDKDAIYHKKYNDILSLLDAGKFDEAKSYARNNDAITVYGHVASFYNRRAKQIQAQRQKEDPCNTNVYDHAIDRHGPRAAYISPDQAYREYENFMYMNKCFARRYPR